MHLYTFYKPHFKRILQLSYPIIIGQIGIVLMGVADTIMIGQLEPTNLAAAGIANSVYFMVTILGIGTLTAISPLVAKAKGAGHTNEVALLYRQGLIASLILSLFVGLILFLLTINLHWFGQAADVNNLTQSYLHYLNAGTPFLLLFMAAKHYSDGLSITKPAAVITIFGLILNVFLVWVFMYGHLGFKGMGINGAGLATTITRVVMAICMIGYIHKQAFYTTWLRVKEKGQETAFLKQIFEVGLPSGFQYFFEVAAFASAAIIIGWFSKTQLAAHQIALNLASITYMVATGISVGGSIAVGDAWGRKHKADIIASGKASLILSVAFMGLTALIFSVFNHFFVGIYTSDAVVAGMAANLLLIAALFQLSDGIQCVSLGILRGLADTKVPTLITIIAYWILGIPIGWYLAKYMGFELYGIWFGLSIGLTFSAVFLTIRFLREANEINFREEEAKHFQQLMH